MQTVARARSGHPVIRQLAINILNYYGSDSHNFVDEAVAIGEYVQNNVRYVKDANGIEQLHDPLTLIEQIQRNVARADCDDMALLIATLLLSIGHTPCFRMVRYEQGKGPFQHIYVVDYAKNGRQPQKRIAIDAIMQDSIYQPIGYEVPHISGEEFEI